MGYYHINNLYKAQEILAFKTCYAMEKIHGTSANVQWKDGDVRYSSGGEDRERFVALFNHEHLTAQFEERFLPTELVVVYGEAYGGKQQRMRKTYGENLRFIAFDVRVGDCWLSVPQAFEFVTHLGLEFVDFVEISTDLAAIDAERDKPSVQATRNGITEAKVREGIVLRPPFEVTLNNGRRIIAKHKREEFAERGSPQLVDIDPSKRQMMDNAQAIADEWVTPMRLTHVIDTLLSSREDKIAIVQDTGTIINLMIEDVMREAEGEIMDNQHVRKTLGARAAKMFRASLEAVLAR